MEGSAPLFHITVHCIAAPAPSASGRRIQRSSGMRRNSGSRPDCRPALPACPAPAEGRPLAAAALRGVYAGSLNEAQRLPPAFQFRERIRGQIAQTPVIQHIEITGIDASVCLHHVLPAAHAVHLADAGRIACKKIHQADKIAHIPKMPLLCFRVPAVKQIFRNCRYDSSSRE